MDKKVEWKYFWLIELLAYWEGRVNSQSLMSHYGISVTQAKKYISAYKSSHPANLAYDSSSKAQVAQPFFQYSFINGDVAEYLDWLNNQPSNDFMSSSGITHAELTIPARVVAPEIMRTLIIAVKQGLRVDVDYVSLSKSTAEGRVIQPHTFVKTGLRWHLRGYCEFRNEYRDFVLSRFRGTPETIGEATKTRDNDPGWSAEVTLRFQPDPRFTTEQKSVIEQDYQMENGELSITTKAALAQYVIQEMQVRIDSLAKTPQQQQLVLVNEEDLKPWLFA